MPRPARSHRSQSPQSVASFAGPGQRGARLLAHAPSSARNSYLNAVDALNDEFAAQLRQRGVPLPGGESTVRFPLYLVSFFQSFSLISGGTLTLHATFAFAFVLLHAHSHYFFGIRICVACGGIRIRDAFGGIRIRVAFGGIRIRVALRWHTHSRRFAVAYAFALLCGIRIRVALWHTHSRRLSVTCVFALLS